MLFSLQGQKMNERFDYFKAMILAKTLLERIHNFRIKFILLCAICSAVCATLGFYAVTTEDDNFIGALIFAILVSGMAIFAYRAHWLDMRDKYYEMIKNDYDYYMTEYKEFIK